MLCYNITLSVVPSIYEFKLLLVYFASHLVLACENGVRIINQDE